MKSIAQLTRQPLKTLSGIVLVALAVAVLCVCLGQAAAAANMRTSMEESYATVALPTNKYLDGRTPEEVLAAVEQLIAENPDLILQDSYSGLASAYIPELHPDNYTNYFTQRSSSSNDILQAYPTGAPYTCAMLEITLTEMIFQITWYTDTPVAELRGTIERVIGLEQGYADPTGFEVILTVDITDQAAWEEYTSDLVIGQRYLVYGTDYVDRDFLLRREIFRETLPEGSVPGVSAAGTAIERFEPENLTYFFPEEEWDSLPGSEVIYSGDTVIYSVPAMDVAYYSYWYEKEDGTRDYMVKCFSLDEMRYSYNKVSLTLQDLSEISGREVDQTPTLIALSGTAEEFLASQEGELWQQALEDLQISNQSFPVVGVDDLRYVGEFATQDTTIAEGRYFTPEELESGANVCVISQLVAQQNGLSLGDTITLRYYNSDENSPLYRSIRNNVNIINHTAAYHTAATPFAGEAETYTIVGLYEQSTLWAGAGDNLYAFTPNTVFVPKNSVTGEMDYSYMGMFRSLVLRNGGISDFELLLEVSDQAGLFMCYDQGYEELANNLYGYEVIADQALRVGLIVYAVVLMLYFVLFPARQGKTLAIMASLGATRWEKLRHVNVSGLGILIPGTLIGLGAGIGLRQKVIQELTSAAEVVLPLEMDPVSLILIAAAQFLLAALLTGLLSIPLTRKKSLMKRRGLTESIRQLRKTPLNTWVVTGFACLIVLVLCALNASNEAERENYERSRLEIPVTVTVMNPQGDQSTGLNLDTWVVNLLTGDFDWGLSEYLTDIRLEFDRDITSINGESADRKMRAMMSVGCAPELLPLTDSSITWLDGYDASIFEGEELVCIVPEGYTLDADPSTDTQELELYFWTEERITDSMGVVISLEEYDYSCTLTVVGTYVSSLGAEDIYCPYRIGDAVCTRLRLGKVLESASATLKNNDDLEAFREAAGKFFLEPGESSGKQGEYSLKIDTKALRKAEAVMNNSIIINQISTLLVFILSAGAGFFLGFLMIRSRKREIILMRTLGKPNGSIYLEFAAEQMGRVLLGALLGGLAFRWQPLGRISLFVLIYFLGLSGALLLFLNSRLITNMKEDA